MGRKFAGDLRAKRRKLSKKAEDLKAGAASLQAARSKTPELELLPFGLEDDVIARSEKFGALATALDSDIRLEELSVFIYIKTKGSKVYRYWKAEWRGHNGKMRQVHLGPVEGKKALSQDEALAKARRAKAEDLKINTAGRED